jgi:hypothetical protein
MLDAAAIAVKSLAVARQGGNMPSMAGERQLELSAYAMIRLSASGPIVACQLRALIPDIRSCNLHT